jgi:hypothetical protein
MASRQSPVRADKSLLVDVPKEWIGLFYVMPRSPSRLSNQTSNDQDKEPPSFCPIALLSIFILRSRIKEKIGFKRQDGELSLLEGNEQSVELFQYVFFSGHRSEWTMGNQRRETRCAQKDGHKDCGLLQKSLYFSFCGLKNADPRLVQ